MSSLHLLRWCAYSRRISWMSALYGTISCTCPHAGLRPGLLWLRGKQPIAQNHQWQMAQDEWAARTSVAYDAAAPRNTLRGRQHPWKTVSVEPTLADAGPLHFGTARRNDVDYSLCRGAWTKGVQSNPLTTSSESTKAGAGNNTGTAELSRVRCQTSMRSLMSRHCADVVCGACLR
jgi:hypothetical protein